MRKGSETVTIRRSQITMNPCNPKRHTDEQIGQQKRNIRAVGFLGGVVWNSETGNLVDGHRRIASLDLINKYDGTPETDYDVKVERVEFDDKTEKEQMTYMAVGNTKADYNIIAEYIDQIDYSAVGMGEDEYSRILELRDTAAGDSSDFAVMDGGLVNTPVLAVPEKEATTEEFMNDRKDKPQMTAEEVKAQKKINTAVSTERQSDMDLYIVVKFSCEEEKEAFCDMNGLVCGFGMTVDGVDLMRKMDGE